MNCQITINNREGRRILFAKTTKMSINVNRNIRRDFFSDGQMVIEETGERSAVVNFTTHVQLMKYAYNDPCFDGEVIIKEDGDGSRIFFQANVVNIQMQISYDGGIREVILKFDYVTCTHYEPKYLTLLERES
jgi:hypothetical protein